MKPFELSFSELEKRIDEMVDETFGDLQSQLLVLPKGDGFVEYENFQEAYELLKQATSSFVAFNEKFIWPALERNALVFIVIRSILGLTPPEWAEIARANRGINITTSVVRGVDREARRNHLYFMKLKNIRSTVTFDRVNALVSVAIDCIQKGSPALSPNLVHRFGKVDTREGLISLHQVAILHVPYVSLLYERLLGRPFASHRDAISELIGDVLESAIENKLSYHKITYRKTGRAERIAGFPQAPDFIIPTEFAPAVIIEAKIAGDDGTARDKVARILRLAEMRDKRIRDNNQAFELVVCIDGRGFGIRRQDMRDMLIATNGKVFTLSTLDFLVQNTKLSRHLRKL